MLKKFIEPIDSNQTELGNAALRDIIPSNNTLLIQVKLRTSLVRVQPSVFLGTQEESTVESTQTHLLHLRSRAHCYWRRSPRIDAPP